MSHFVCSFNTHRLYFAHFLLKFHALDVTCLQGFSFLNHRVRALFFEGGFVFLIYKDVVGHT
jgi:hypothetical protein